MSRKKPIVRSSLLLGLALTAVLGAAVDYIPEQDVLCVTDYPADFPCTPHLLARIDQAFGWGKVRYDERTRTCTVLCALRIGQNDGSETYFQVGSEACPDETLIVRGNVHVYSTWLTGQNRPLGTHQVRALGRANRLTLGVRGKPEVRAALRLDNRAGAGHTITIGGTSGYGSENCGGQLCVFNSTIAPFGERLIGDAKQRDQPVFAGGSDLLEFHHAGVRGVRSQFGRHLTRGVFEHTRFENCGTAFAGNYQTELRGCTFVGCGLALQAANRRDLTIYDCTFEGNAVNWSVQYRRLVAIDCTVDTYAKGRYSNPAASKPAPFFVAKRHLVVRVLDRDGTPVAGCSIKAACAPEVAAEQFDRCHAATGPDGRTPGRDAQGALLLSEVMIRAGDGPEAAPVQTQYVYTIEAAKDGRTARLEQFVPRSSWAEVPLTLD